MHSRIALVAVTVLSLVALAAIVFAPASFVDHKYGRQGWRTSGAKEALDAWNAQRAYPDAVLPATGYAQAFAESRARLAGLEDALDVPPWEPIGPHNIGGRTLCLWINPENPATIWAGSASGGLWRTYVGGIGADAWDRVTTGFPVLGVGGLVAAAGDTATLYAGTGEVYGYQNAQPGVLVRTTRGSYGIGILKTTDGGTTWTKSLDWSYDQRRGVAWLAAHPTDPATIWAATTEGTYKTTDAGASWNRMHDVLMAMHVVIDPQDPERVYVACGDLGSPGTGIYRTENGGTSWTQLTQGLPGSWTGKAWLDIYDTHPNVLYASVANDFAGLGLYRSLDHGDSWMRIASTDYAQYQGWYSHWVSVNDADSSKVLCGGIDTWRSNQGGQNLQRVSYWYLWYFGDVPAGGPEGPSDYVHADNHCVVRHPQDPDLVYMGTDGGVFLSYDGGSNFTGLNGGYQTQQFYNGFSTSLSQATPSIGGLQDNATAIYDGDLSWFRCIGGDGCWTAINPVDPQIMFGSSQYLNIQRSLNGGSSWNGATSGIGNDEAAFAAPYLICYGMPDILYAAKTKVYKSTSNGSSWSAVNQNQPLDGNPVISLGMSWFDCNVVYAGTGPLYSRMHVLVTTDGGTSWTDITGPLPDRYPADIAVDPFAPATAYVALSGFGVSHLWKTTDTGQSWSDVGAGLPDVPTQAVVVDPDNPNIVYCGNDLGVYVSTNGGTTWAEFQDGMPPAMVYDLSVVYTTRRLRVATHGNGAYERDMLDATTAVAAGETTGETAGGAPAAGDVLRMPPVTPNPFNPTTDVRFELAERRHVKVSVIDAAGRLVTTLLDAPREAGAHSVRFDAGGLASGVYFARIEAGGATAVRKMVLGK
ncbi:MAG: T9SS type A sorting domain-containing protein [Candidatus Eiseniibacteriota bacterium]|jgi:photosystem II stability/assembly factor-like uncharacterized protein